jgi:uncharacterized protein YhaN
VRIRGWNVDGFGIFQSYEVRDLPDGLTVFHGANEAGKSTLLAFLRGMLFGFPDRRGSAARYPPLHGGRHGGRLIVDVDDASLIIDRDAGRKAAVHVGRCDGRSGSIEDLADALAGADEQLFRSIFAFSLTELQTFESLTVDGIRDRIFTAGIAGAGRSARAVIDMLEERSRLLLRRSSRARITALVAELNRVREALDAARIAAVQYRDRLAEEEQWEQETRRLADALSAARHEHERQTALIDLWPVWCMLREARAERQNWHPVPLPTDAEVRLAGLNEVLVVSRRAADAVAAELAAARAQQAQLHSARDPFTDLQEVESFYLELPLRRDRLQAMEVVQARLVALDADIAARLTHLGPDWDEARFVRCAAQQPALDEVRFWEQQIAGAAAVRERAQAQHQRCVRRTEELIAERDDVRARLPADAPPSLTLLAARDAAIRRLRAHIVDLRAVHSDAEASDRVVADGTQALRAFEATSVRINPYWIASGIVLVLGAGGAVAGWRETLADRPGALVAAAATGVLVLTLEVLRQWASRREGQRREHVRVLVAEIDEAMQAREAYRARAAALRAEVNVDRDALELSTLSYGVIDEEDKRLQRQRAERARWDEISAQVARLDATLEEARHTAEQAADQRAVAERAWVDAQQRWDAWLRPCGLDGTGTPSDVVALLGSMDTCREVWTQGAHERARAAALQDDIAIWEGRARSLLERAGSAAVTCAGNACLDRIVALHERWLVERERRETQASTEQHIATGERRLAELEQEVATVGAARADLLHACSAADEDEFRRHLSAFHRALELDRTIADGERQIVARVGIAQAQATWAELATEDVGTWQAQCASRDANIGTLEVERDDAVRRHHDARRIRCELEESAAVATLEAEYEGLRTELDAAVDEWRVTTAARALIEETLREFERSRQPAVLAEAGKVLAAVTHGRYTGVLQDDDQIVVVDQSGARKGPGELSRGTVEQLYLCVRLGLAAEFGRRSACLPLIMDDVLVNFDPERAAALAAAVAEFARTHQVLFFTCQPATRDLLVDVGRAARVVEMSANGDRCAQSVPHTLNGPGHLESER